MTLPLSWERQQKIRNYWMADGSLTYRDVAERFAVSIQQVRTACRGLPITDARKAAQDRGRRSAALREQRRRG